MEENTDKWSDSEVQALISICKGKNAKRFLTCEQPSLCPISTKMALEVRVMSNLAIQIYRVENKDFFIVN